MKKIVLLMLGFAGFAFAAGFSSTGKQVEKLLDAPNGKQYEYVIGSAGSTGSYYKAGNRLVDLMGVSRKRGLMKAYNADTDGTLMNFDLMEDGYVNVIFVQGDAVAYKKAKEPEWFKNKLVMKLPRQEFVQLIMRKGMDEDDLQSKGAKVFVGLPTSGGMASWMNISLLEDNYARASVVNGDVDDSALQDLEDGVIDAIIRTSYLKPKTDQLAIDVANNKKLYFADFDDSNLNNKIDLGNGAKQIYTFEEVDVAKALFDTEAECLGTNVYIIVDKSTLTKKQLNKIIRTIKANAKSLFN